VVVNILDLPHDLTAIEAERVAKLIEAYHV
jgi:hypothetical protein